MSVTQQLTLSSRPGAFDVQPSAMAAGQPVTDDLLLKISATAKFGVVRPEFFTSGTS
jgi:hypothetical protein